MPEKRGHAELHAQKRHRQVIHRCHTVKHREQKFAQGIIHLRVIIRAAPCHSGRVKPASGFCVIKSVTSLVIPIFSGRKSPSSARNRGKSVLTFSRLALMNSGVHFLFFFRLMCRHFVFHSSGRKLRRRRSDYMFLRWWRRNNVAFFFITMTGVFFCLPAAIPSPGKISITL